MKWLVATVVLVCLLVPIEVGAQPPPGYADVTVTASPEYLVMPPAGFTVYYISDYEVGLSWTRPANVDNVLIRGGYGRVPADREDGFFVYEGSGNSTTHWVALDTIDGPIYYRAWSQNTTGTWDTTGAIGQIEGVTMTLLLFGMLGMGFTFGFFWKRSAFFAYGAAGVWALLGFMSLGRSAGANPTDITDVYMGLFWLCMGFMIGCALLPSLMKEKALADEEGPLDALGDDLSSFMPKKKDEPRPRPTRYRL